MTKMFKATATAIGAALIAGLLTGGAVYAQSSGAKLKALGGEQVLEQTNMAPVTTKQSLSTGFDRAYRQQPPLIPHKVEGYEVSLGNNKCMTCHDWPASNQMGAPKLSETHYVDRQGVRLDKVAGTRYFCQQCHVPQVDARPLVGNSFENATQAK